MRVRFSKGNKRGWRNYVKGHIVIGTRTNIVCACDVAYGNESDVSKAQSVIEKTGANFNMKEFSGDKAYSAKRIYEILEQFDTTPFIAYKKNASDNPKGPKTWVRMYSFFKNNNELFMKHYHKRSNVETVFSMVKMRLGEFLKCKTFDSQRSELIMKFICHNICCLVQEMFERGVQIDFKKCSVEYKNYKVARKLGDMYNLSDIK